MAERKFVLLVVDDDEFNRRIIARILKREDYGDVETAENGREALEMMKVRDFDAVLLDIEMPEVDGFEVLEHMRTDMRLRDIPVIMISSVEGTDAVIKCIELGAADYLPKPFNPVLLRARLGACLERKRLRDQEAVYMEKLTAEKRRADELLHAILPSAAMSELQRSGKVKARRYDNVALLFCDVVGFTAFCDEHDPEEVVSHLQELIEAFEDITRKHEMEKIKTIGDEFMATAGMLLPNAVPLLSAVTCGLEMANATRQLALGWEVRVGVHAGPVVAGIVGGDKYQFDVWGDTVNVAARMAGIGNPGVVILTYNDWMQVKDACNGRSLGLIDVKGKGGIEVVEVYELR